MVTPKVKIWNLNGVLDTQDGLTGLVPLADNDPLRATYSCWIPGYTPPATPGDIVEIRGAAGKITRIRQIVLSGTATAASNILVGLIVRSAANTQTLNAAVPLITRDPNHDAATSTVKTASANPSAVGATARGAGYLNGTRLNLAPAANGGIDRNFYQFSWLNDKAPMLQGANDCLYISLASSTSSLTGPAWPSGGVLDIDITLSEEAIPG